MEFLMDPQVWLALLTLTLLEIVLGVDNIIFISILANKLPEAQQDKARKVGLMMALGTRLILLCSIAWIAKLTTPLFTVMEHGFSGRDLVLLIGGLFLLAKSTHEIHDSLEVQEVSVSTATHPTFLSVVAQIAVLDLVFSLDSVITAIGLVDQLWVMVTAVIISMIVMLIFAKAIAEFIEKHPTFRMLALSFLLMIGFALVAESFHIEVPKGYIYFAMGFSVAVELLNMKVRSRRRKPVKLHKKMVE